jgi:hypothetical protein
MQPFSPAGSKLRLAFVPIVFAIAFLVMIGSVAVIAKLSSTDIQTLLRTESLWPLALIFPALAFGFILGLITVNLVAFSIPPLRRVFEGEVKATGRHSFSEGDIGPAKVASAYRPDPDCRGRPFHGE